MKYLESVWSMIAKLLSLAFVVLLPVRPIMIAVGVLVVADMVSGVWASKKEGKKITSNGFKRTVVKCLLYEASIVVAFLLETYMMPDIPFIKIAAAAIGLTEAKSFSENMRRITGIDLWTEALKKIHAAASVDVQKKDDEK